MRIKLLLTIAIGAAILAAFPASSQNTNNITTGINFVHVPVDRVLDMYKQSSKSELIIASDVRQATHGITLHAVGVSPDAVPKLIEQALLKQAGIVITHLDDKRISVTYNDQLPLEK